MSNLRIVRKLTTALLLSVTVVSAADRRRTPIVAAFEANKDAVVSISSRQVRTGRNDFFNLDIEDFLFGRPRVVVPSLGSGFVIDGRGYIVTNAHVVERAVSVSVLLPGDESRYEAELIDLDKSADLAVLKIDPPRALATVKLGYSDDLMIGEAVLAIGNPFGYQQTLTDGIISAIHRDLELPQGAELSDLIQLSAPINPGNSGGPLLNINGEVIGINTAIRRAAQGIGFAIPIDNLRRCLPAMLNIDTLYRIDFGAAVEELPRRPDAQGELFKPKGVRVAKVRADSAAARAGLRRGDVISAVDGEEIGSVIDFSLSMLEKHVDRQVKFRLRRGDNAEHAQLVLRQRPKPDGAALMAGLFGIRVGELPDRIAQRFGYSGDRLVVVSVERGCQAHEAGIEPGDVLGAVGGVQIHNLDELGLVLEKITAGAAVAVVLERLEEGRLLLRRIQYERTLHGRDRPVSTGVL